MRAIRDEYLKLPGIRFGWVTGKRAKEVSTIILNFSEDYLRRLPMRKYTFWDALNRKYHTNITIMEEDKRRAYIRFPEGKYKDLELKAILRKYRQLPGIASVRMDIEKREDEKEHREQQQRWSNSSLLVLPPKRSLRSWMRLSNADTNHISFENPEQGNANDLSSREQSWASNCIHN